MNPESKTTAANIIRVLVLEDRSVDAEIMIRELRRAGFHPEARRVDTEAEFEAQLSPDLDLILADYHLPTFTGLDALRHVQKRNLDVPFIIVSGALGDELAVRCIKEGVTDYLLKDRPERLGLAVAHAIEERRLRAERRAIDEQLRHAQKMEITGQLAGGIAHDFGNILCVINGWASLLLEDKSLGPKCHTGLREIYTAGARATGLTRQLLYFSSKRPVDRRLIDLNVVIEEIAKILQRLVGEDIVLETALAAGQAPVEADATMMEQVLFNLAVNGRDAMKRHGKMVMGTEVVELLESEVEGKPGARPGRFVRLSVRDNGSGIAPDVLPRIFEPFFTTKGPGKGTGLGLATVFGIAKQHDGWIEVQSEVGAGTTFNVFLPASNRDATGTKPRSEIEGFTISGGSETILVVEDETSVREYVVAALQPRGYRVLQARSGKEALEVWKRHSARIELLLTDVVMPDDMSGPELAAGLLAEKPGIKVIFASGYSPDAMRERFPTGNSVRLLHKPYSPSALSKLVREVLDERK